MMNTSEHDGRRRVSPRLYLIVGALLIALPLLGYFVSNWYVTKKRWAEDCFRRPLQELLEGHEGGVASAVFLPDGHRALSGGGGDGKIRFWDLEQGNEIRRLAEDVTVWSVAVSSDGRRALSGSEIGTVRLWNLETGREIGQLTGHASQVTSVSFFPNGRRALSGSANGAIRLWDLGTGREIRKIAGGRRTAWSIAFSPDGRRALSTGEDGIRLWDLEGGRLLRLLSGHGRVVTAVAFSSDGERALAGDNGGTIRIWDVGAGREIGELAGHAGMVYSVAFGPDGRRAISAGGDGELRLWDLKTERLIRAFIMPEHEGMRWLEFSDERLRRPDRIVHAVAFSPDGRRVLSAGWWRDEFGGYFSELLLWRLPDKVGYWLLGTQEEEKSE